MKMEHFDTVPEGQRDLEIEDPSSPATTIPGSPDANPGEIPEEEFTPTEIQVI